MAVTMEILCGPRFREEMGITAGRFEHEQWAAEIIDRQPRFTIPVDNDVSFCDETYDQCVNAIRKQFNALGVPDASDLTIDGLITCVGSKHSSIRKAIEEFHKQFNQRKEAQEEAYYAAFISWAKAGYPDVDEWPAIECQ